MSDLELAREAREASQILLGSIELQLASRSDYDFTYAVPGNVSLALPFFIAKQDSVPHLAAICELRSRFAVELCCLSAILRLRMELELCGWSDIGLADLCDELRQLYDERLSRFPVIRTNPFEQELCRYG